MRRRERPRRLRAPRGSARTLGAARPPNGREDQRRPRGAGHGPAGTREARPASAGTAQPQPPGPRSRFPLGRGGDRPQSGSAEGAAHARCRRGAAGSGSARSAVRLPAPLMAAPAAPRGSVLKGEAGSPGGGGGGRRGAPGPPGLCGAVPGSGRGAARAGGAGGADSEYRAVGRPQPHGPWRSAPPGARAGRAGGFRDAGTGGGKSILYQH